MKFLTPGLETVKWHTPGPESSNASNAVPPLLATTTTPAGVIPLIQDAALQPAVSGLVLCAHMLQNMPRPPAAAAAGSGWVSGTISNPTGCSDVSAHTCKQCHKLAGGSAAAAAEGCRACIRAKNVTAALEVSMGDMAEVWCKGPDGSYAMIAADGNTRFSEFGCLYDVGVVMQGASVKTAGASRTDCEARRVRDVCQDEDYTC